MKKATIHFEYADSADFALGRLKALPLQNLKITPIVRQTDDLPAQYPVGPEELYGNHTAYLNGLPHITEGGPVYNAFFEPAQNGGAILQFSAPDEQVLRQALSIALQAGGYDISVKE